MTEDGDMDEEPQGMDEFDWVMKVSLLCYALFFVFCHN